MDNTERSTPQDLENKEHPRTVEEMLREYLSELTVSVRRENAKMETAKNQSFGKKGLTFLNEHEKSISTIISVLTLTVTVFSLMFTSYWTVSTWRQENSEKRESERRTQIAQYATLMADDHHRKTAAAAYAEVAREESIQLLIELVKSTRDTVDDEQFRSVVRNACLRYDSISMEHLLRLNRDIINEYRDSFTLSPSSKPVLAFCQQTIKGILEKRRFKLAHDWSFSNIGFIDLEMTSADFHGVAFKNAVLSDVRFCEVNFRNCNLSGLYAANSTLGNGIFQNADVTEAIFSLSDLGGADFSDAKARSLERRNSVSFHGARLITTTFKKAELPHADFTDSVLWQATFRNSNLVGATFNSSDCWKAEFVGANLNGADFRAACLEGAVFENADLANVLFFTKVGDRPELRSHMARLDSRIGYPIEEGAYVRDASFRGAKNLTADQLDYLYKWGAINLPAHYVPASNSPADADYPENVGPIRGGFSSTSCDGGGI